MFLTRILKRGAKPAFEPERELATFSPFRSASPLKFDSQAINVPHDQKYLLSRFLLKKSNKFFVG